MIATVLSLGSGRATEFASPDHQRLVEQTASFQILQQTGDRLIGGKGIVLVSGFETAVLVPGLKASRCVIELHESHAPLDEAPGQKTLAAEQQSASDWASRHNQNACSDSYCSSKPSGIRLSLLALRSLAEWYQLFTRNQGGNTCLTQQLSPPALVAAGGSNGESGCNGGRQTGGALAENSARRAKRRSRHDDKNDSADTSRTGGEA